MGLYQFDTALRQIVEHTITVEIDIYDGGVDEFKWTNKHSKTLAVLVQEGFISREDLSRWIHIRLLRVGRECYDQHKQRDRYPDHTLSASAFAYALKHGEFSHREEVSIKFDHGETKETFILKYECGIAEKVREQLLTEREPRKFADVPDCCESHH